MLVLVGILWASLSLISPPSFPKPYCLPVTVPVELLLTPSELQGTPLDQRRLGFELGVVIPLEPRSAAP
jgi:hypothetical protein